MNHKYEIGDYIKFNNEEYRIIEVREDVYIGVTKRGWKQIHNTYCEYGDLNPEDVCCVAREYFYHKNDNMNKHYMIYNKGQRRFRGNIVEIIEYFFKVANEIGCHNPHFNYDNEKTEVVFEGYYSDVKFTIEEVES